jgi:hypothetical protein
VASEQAWGLQRKIADTICKDNNSVDQKGAEHMTKIDQLYYTSCPREKGRDDYDGFQVKACSEGISPEDEKRIRLYSENYVWPASLDSLISPGPLAKQDLALFPIALHYYFLPDGRAALTHTSISPVQPRRAGNFFSHTLVFDTEELIRAGCDPFALARSGVFQLQDETDAKTIPCLDGFAQIFPSGRDEESYPVPPEPYKEYLAALIDAVSADDGKRPVIIVPIQLNDAWDLVETVFRVVPLKRRMHIEFSIYEPQPYRILNAAYRHLNDRNIAVTTSLPKEGGTFKFRSDEYEGLYRIFNFAETRFSTMPEPSLFAKRMAGSLSKGDFRDIAQVHAGLDRLKLADSGSGFGSAALPAIDCLGSRVSREDMDSALKSFVDSCISADQAEAAFDALLDITAAGAGQYSDDEYLRIFACMETLGKRITRFDELQEKIVTKLGRVAGELFLEGRTAVMDVSVKVAMQAAPDMLGEAVRLVLEKWIAHESQAHEILCLSPQADLAALSGLFDGGLHALARKDEYRLYLNGWFPEALRLASAAGFSAALWTHMEQWFFSDYLNKLPSWNDANVLTGKMKNAVSDGQSPRITLDLLRWKLTKGFSAPSSEYTKNEKALLFSDIAAVCGKADDPAASASTMIETVKGVGLSKEDHLLFLEDFATTKCDALVAFARKGYCECLGVFYAEDKSEETPAKLTLWNRIKLFFQRDTAKKKPRDEAAEKDNEQIEREDAVWEWRYLAARCSAFNLLADDFISSIRSCPDTKSKEQIGKWVQKVFRHSAEANQHAVERLIAFAETCGDTGAARDMLYAYLVKTKQLNSSTDVQPIRAIAALALSRTIPLWGLSADYSEVLSDIKTDTWPEADVSRFALMRMIASVNNQYLSSGIKQGVPFDKVFGKESYVYNTLLTVRLGGNDWEDIVRWSTDALLSWKGGSLCDIGIILDILSMSNYLEQEWSAEERYTGFAAIIGSMLYKKSLVRQVEVFVQLVTLTNEEIIEDQNGKAQGNFDSRSLTSNQYLVKRLLENADKRVFKEYEAYVADLGLPLGNTANTVKGWNDGAGVSKPALLQNKTKAAKNAR